MKARAALGAILAPFALIITVAVAFVMVIAVLTCLTDCAPKRQAASVNLLGFVGEEPHAICQAFAVRGSPVRLYTAAHCLQGAPPGDLIAYSTEWQWTHTMRAYSWARIVRVDRGADRATLAPDEADVFDALEPVAVVPVAVTAIAPGWARAPGVVKEISGRYYLSSLDVRPGWSGSPVLDGRGRVVGIVTAYEAETETGAPVPHSGIFVGLE